jgi:thymidylate synthase
MIYQIIRRMRMEASKLQATRYLKMWGDIMKSHNTISPRGMEIKEIEDLQLLVDPRYPFMTFTSRKYNLDYFKKEMTWKLTANKYDKSIMEHAKMWAKVINPNGTFNSNYGQYWFGEQMGVWNVVMELIRDRDSRRAVIPMLNASHMTPETTDTVCTESVGFRIRTDKEGKLILNMSVHMRSSDTVYGLGTDIPTFSFLYRMVYALLSLHYNMEVGYIIITAMSSHIYSTHYDMINKILQEGVNSYVPEYMPFCNISEAMSIIAKRGKFEGQYGSLSSWMLSLI